LIITDSLAGTEDIAVMLGNRNLRPTKTINYEVGLERNFLNFFVLDVTGFYKDSRNTVRTVEVSTPRGTYRTNGNGDYSDVRGIELSIRKIPSMYRWGALWGYANYTTQVRINGRSGDPVAFSPNQVRYAPSGDFVEYQNPIFKAGLFYATPPDWSGTLGMVFKDLSLSLDYYANFPDEHLRQDIFVLDGEVHARPVDQNVNFRARKEIRVGGARVSPYLEVENLLNHQWIALSTFERVSTDEMRKFVESDFDYLPSVTNDGTPIMPIAQFRNLPRSVTFGITLEM
jgi:outer membrane receptor protein involved in Fe transport